MKNDRAFAYLENKYIFILIFMIILPYIHKFLKDLKK
jgi:hypothetical protein